MRITGVSKTYGKGANAVHALRDVSYLFPPGTFTAVMGPSGSGKSTFLHCAAGLDKPDAGSVHLGDVDLARMNERKLTELRRQRVGFVFQAFNLISSLTVRDNILLPARLAGTKADKVWFQQVVSEVGLTDRLHHRPGELSGGQQQRVAIARALVTRPDVVFGDEPTGALDTTTGGEVLSLLRRVVDLHQQTVIMVTHDPVAASYADRVVFLADGRLVGHLDQPTAAAVADRMTHLSGKGAVRC
ncbi:ABC transporter ATP-binding protein [Amycolatopsis sp. cg5]|uniref:ABC transporter ATP-binding protein n=1 Tax=Amycolatopsis sp. cg5 TaxID=3238802 RepID=UPI003524AD1B